MAETVLDVKNLKKHFGSTKAVDGITFQAERGDIFGFLGPNGAGKTTTIRMLMDFIRPTDGVATILGKDSYKDSVELKSNIGYLSGSIEVYEGWTGKEHFDFYEKANGQKSIARELAGKLVYDPKKKAKNLSSGNRQKLGVILAMMFEPEILILDEPTLALDPLLQNTIYDLLNERVAKGATVFMSSHNLSEVERVCNRVGIIRQGKMVAVESIQSLKSKKVHEVKVVFNQQINPDDFKRDGITIVHSAKDSISFNIRGDVSPAVKALSAYGIKSLDISTASLENVFLEFYQ